MKFWLKTLLYYFNPFRSGILVKYRIPKYVNSQKRHTVRKRSQRKSSWKEKYNDNFQYRNYKDYNEYLNHQASKLNYLLKQSKDQIFSNEKILKNRLKFYRRFCELSNYLPKSALILCAGARHGTEVEVIQDLGFKNAYGIDINPGPNNKFVRIGDFMNLENPDSSLDMIYSNCVDHAFNLESFFSEHARAIKPDGLVMYEVSRTSIGTYEAVQWSSLEVLFNLMLKYFERAIKIEKEDNWSRILLQGKKNT